MNTTDREDPRVTTRYYLLVRDGEYKVGDRPTDTEYMEINPRVIEISEVFDGDPVDLITGYRLARLTAVDDGYVVKGFDVINAVLGPQARELMRVIPEADRVLTTSGKTTDAYIEAINAQFDKYECLVDPHIDAARIALSAVGADDYFWWNVGGCAYGNEVLALAARDLIGTVSGWDQEAYDALTLPWLVSFGWPVHPKDKTKIPA